MYADGTCPSTTAADGTVTRGSCPDAYGMVLGKWRTWVACSICSDFSIGTSLICAFLEVFMSFIPVRVLKRIFPPMVTGLLHYPYVFHIR